MIVCLRLLWLYSCYCSISSERAEASGLSALYLQNPWLDKCQSAAEGNVPLVYSLPYAAAAAAAADNNMYRPGISWMRLTKIRK